MSLWLGSPVGAGTHQVSPWNVVWLMPQDVIEVVVGVSFMLRRGVGAWQGIFLKHCRCRKCSERYELEMEERFQEIDLVSRHVIAITQ